jgi:hypothetical protein
MSTKGTKKSIIRLGLLIGFSYYPKATVEQVELKPFSCFSCLSWTMLFISTIYYTSSIQFNSPLAASRQDLIMRHQN